jgi:ribose transport system permease protein
VLQNGLNLVGVQALWRGVVTGVVLILAVWVDRLRRRGAT